MTKSGCISARAWTIGNVIVCSPPRQSGLAPARSTREAASKISRNASSSAVPVRGRSPRSEKTVSDTSRSRNGEYVSIDSEASRMACGARAVPLRYVEVISRGQPTMAGHPGVSVRETHPRNMSRVFKPISPNLFARARGVPFGLTQR